MTLLDGMGVGGFRFLDLMFLPLCLPRTCTPLYEVTRVALSMFGVALSPEKRTV